MLVALAAAVIGFLVGTLRAARRAEQLSVELESTRAKLTSESDQRNRTSELLSQAEAQVRAAVESASRAALNSNSETFLKLAREVFGRDQATASASLKEREDAIKQLVDPIRAALVKQETQAQELERLRVESHGKLGGQIEGLMNVQSILQRETRNLSTALRRPEVRGRWGELTLRRVVELSGMSEHCDFAEQPEVQTSEGTLRPDLLVRMPEARDLVVDAKTPLDAYMDAIEANDDDTRAHRARAPRAPRRTTRARARPEELLGAVRKQPGVRGVVPAGRPVPVGRARRAPRPARQRAQAEHHHRDAVDA